MPILKRNSRSKKMNGRIVGMVFPPELHSYFSLFALAKGLTKTIIVKQQMEMWWDAMLSTEEGCEDVLIDELIIKIRIEWNLLKVECPEKPFYEFKRELKAELNKKGVLDSHINKIIGGIYGKS